MKHAVIIAESDKGRFEQVKDVKMPDGSTLCLAEQVYTPEELEAFNAEAGKWIVRRRGSCHFYADSDSGEDAWGSYCNHFDLVPEHAIFDGDRFVGLYLPETWIRESGNGRYDFTIDDWGYPGYSLFYSLGGSYAFHAFLFAEDATRSWHEFTLMERDPEAVYESYLEF